eukprot:s1910_g1.t1
MVLVEHVSMKDYDEHHDDNEDGGDDDNDDDDNENGLSGSRLWLWDAGAPSVVSAAPRFTEDVQSLGAATLQNLGYARMTAANRKLALHAVLLPVAPPKTRPVLVRFFNDKVWEVGAHIFHVPDQEDEVDRRRQRRTGVPNIVPESLMVMARAHLEKPENVSLRKAFCWCLEDNPDPVTIPPLRLLEVRNSRIERGSCHSSLDGCFISGAWPMLMAWLGFVVVGLGTCCNAYKHLLNFTRPDLQPHVLRIILVGPIYAFSASLCLSMSENACFFVRSVRDIWEAVVIYSFLTLIIEYMGGEHLCLHSISQRDEAVPHLFPCNLCREPGAKAKDSGLRSFGES